MTDSDTLLRIQRRLTNAVDELKRIAPDVADAKQIKDFSDDRKKRAFSVLVAEQLNSGKSVAAAEHYARSCDTWGKELNDLGEQLKTALRVIESHAATQAQFDAARSLFSAEKEKMKL